MEHGVKVGNGSGQLKGRSLGHQHTCFWVTSESLDEFFWSCIFKLIFDISCVNETGPCVLCYVGNLDFAFEMLFPFFGFVQQSDAICRRHSVQDSICKLQPETQKGCYTRIGPKNKRSHETLGKEPGRTGAEEQARSIYY